MSGFPVKTQADINKYRNEYLETLRLQEQINDMNLQANKTYLLTGQLPPQSQLQDTRTSAEKLADIELLKQNLSTVFSPIAEPQFSNEIINKIMNSPLNIDNSLIRFLAQRGTEIVSNLQGLYPYKIRGDPNDLEQIVLFIKNMYAGQQDKFQSVKSYINSTQTQTQSNQILSANNIDPLITQFIDLKKSIEIVRNSIPQNYTNAVNNNVNKIYDKINKIRNLLPTTHQIELLLQDIDNPTGIQYNNLPNTEQYNNVREPYSAQDMAAFFQLLEKLPKYNILNVLMIKAKSFISSNNFKSLISTLQKIIEELDAIKDNELDILVQIGERIISRQKEKEDILRNQTQQQARVIQEQQVRQQHDMSNAQKVYVVNQTEDDAVWVRSSNGQVQLPQPSVRQAIQFNAIDQSNTPSIKETIQSPSQQPKQQPTKFNPVIALGSMAGDAKKKSIAMNLNKLSNTQINDLIALRSQIDDTVVNKDTLIQSLVNDIDYNRGDIGLHGMGIKKRRGRPRGSGLPKQEPIKIPNFVGFGINEINQKQLKNGIVKIRRNTRTNYPDMPSKHVSPKLQSILSSIVGGGVPNFNDLNSLDNEEKDYLHKLVSRSNLEDRLSIPAPTKDQQEKDLNSFEIMKGQIMAGNDSQELVKKFKLLIRKLSKQGLLPKNDVEDIIDLLLTLGY